MEIVQFPIAFICGFFSFISPCILAMGIPYLTYITGVEIETLRSSTTSRMRFRNIFMAICFVSGFSTIFTFIGFNISFISRLLTNYSQLVRIASGIIVIVMGLHIIGAHIPWLAREVRLFNFNFSRSGPLIAYFIGIAFATSWTPCISPMLGIVLSLAVNVESAFTGTMLLLTYSLGLGIPFILSAICMSSFMEATKHIKRLHAWFEPTIGTSLIIMGIVFISGI